MNKVQYLMQESPESVSCFHKGVAIIRCKQHKCCSLANSVVTVGNYSDELCRWV